MDGIMKKQISKISLTLLICIPLLMVLVNSAGAQTPTATPTSLPTSTLPPTPTLNPTLVSSLPSDVLQLANPDVVTFSQLRQSEIQLNGPYDSKSIYFIIPADWNLKEGIQLDLFVGVSFNSGLKDQGNVIGGGTLTVLLNNIVLDAAPLNDVGETEIKINIPVSTALSNDGAMSVRFVLDSGTSCRIVGWNTTVYIHISIFRMILSDHLPAWLTFRGRLSKIHSCPILLY
jgi:hypothetical protein